MYLILISVGYEVNGAYLYLKDRAKAATYMHATPKTSTKRFCDCLGLIIYLHLYLLLMKFCMKVIICTIGLSFFNHVNVQVGVVSECCTNSSCPTMAAGKE